jgi:hypothetical protein
LWSTRLTQHDVFYGNADMALLPSTIRGIIAEATVRTLAEARAPLQDLGFAIIEDMTEVYAPKNRCTKEQRDFIHKCKYALPTSTLPCHPTMFMSHFSCYTDDTDNGLEHVFEGVVKNSIVDHVVPHYDENSANPRLQLKTDTVREEYSKLYDEQLRNIIEGYDVFHGDEDPIAFNSTTTGRTKGRPQNKNMSSAPPVLKGHVEGLFPRYSRCAVILYTQGVLVPIPAPILNSFRVKVQVGLVKKVSGI